MDPTENKEVTVDELMHAVANVAAHAFNEGVACGKGAQEQCAKEESKKQAALANCNEIATKLLSQQRRLTEPEENPAPYTWFDDFSFGPGLKVRHRGILYDVVAVNFPERLLELGDAEIEEEGIWVRAENLDAPPHSSTTSPKVENSCNR